MKIFRWLGGNLLFLITLFLLIFIPLYPKLPLIDIQHTWVYIRAEDFIVVLTLMLWIILMLCKKTTFRTPLTIPIMLFWIVGAISTLHGILLIFPTLGDVFSNVALLSYLRRIEYVSLFFVAYSGMRDKRFIPYIVAVLAMTLFCVIGYGFGQKYLGFPAFLTMNEEFAKGIPLRLSSLSRVSSTFGGHYDLAAYLVLIIPLLASMIFGFRDWFIKAFLLTTVFFGFTLLFMTVSRISFFVLLLSMIMMLILQKKKLAILAIISLFLMGFVFLSFSTSLLQRFGDTLKEVDVLVDAKTGEAIGHVKEASSEDFKNKIIHVKFVESKREIEGVISEKKKQGKLATESAKLLPFLLIPSRVPLVVEPNSPTGENLPQGTGYINLTLAPVTKKIDRFFYKISDYRGEKDSDILGIEGNFLIKRVLTYDMSFTTRFQGEWPRAIEIFKKDILFGGGYSATGLAVDNNYFRILGEIGLLGFFSYFAIFLFAVIYIKKVLPEVDSPIVKSFVLGFIAGAFGLVLNAIFIDVFEASKIAFVFWLLMGITLGVLHLYQKQFINLYKEFKKIIISTQAIIIYLFITIVVALLTITNYYFVGDDFTWFRWIADCNSIGRCQSIIATIFDYFTQANGFFYRPGMKLYFLLMYSGFWLNQTVYHMVSILLHFIVTMLLFLISKKIFKDFLLSTIVAFLFVVLSGYSEAVFWISSTGFLFNALFVLLSLFFFILFEEKKKNIYFIFSFVSIIFGLIFHELGVIAPLLIILYRIVFGRKVDFKELFKDIHYTILFFPILPYLGLRLLAQSHWFSGDYSYNLFKLPFNIVGNTIGYLILTLFGPRSLPLYQTFRNFSKEHLILISFASVVVIIIVTLVYKMIIRKMVEEERRIIIFCFFFFVVSLLPFLGFGNIASRYSYLSSIGFIILFVFFLKKTYSYLTVNNGQYIAISSIMVVVGIFGLIHIVQLQEIHRDWREAGEKSNKFIISLNEVYRDYWTKEHMQFYFVNVPIKHGNAWVFPVGLKDAVWFVFRNENIDVYQLSSVDQGLNLIKNPRNEKVFEFSDSGAIIERKLLKLQ